MPLRKARKSSRTRISLGRARQSKAAKMLPTIRSGLRIPMRNTAAPRCATESGEAIIAKRVLGPLLSLEHHRGSIVIERSLIDLSAGVLFELDGYTVLTLHLVCRLLLEKKKKNQKKPPYRSHHDIL